MFVLADSPNNPYAAQAHEKQVFSAAIDARRYEFVQTEAIRCLGGGPALPLGQGQ